MSDNREQDKIALALYHKLKELHDTDEYSSLWVKCIKTVLDEIKLGHLWNSPPDEFNPNSLKVNFDNKLKVTYGQEWLHHTYETNVCNTYRIFKGLYKPKYAFSLCTFRCVNH